MTEIVAKVADLIEICHLVSLKGKDIKGKEIMAISNFLISAENDKLTIKAREKKNAIVLSLEYNCKVTSPGLISVGSVQYLLDVLGRFNGSDEVNLSTVDNKVVITRLSPQKIARIPSFEVSSNKGAEEILNNFKPTDQGYFKSSKTYFNICLTVNSEDIGEAIEDGEAVKQRIYPWTLDNGLLIKVGDEKLGEIETSIPIKQASVVAPTQPKTKTTFAYGIDNIFGNLSGEIKVFLVNEINDCPIIIKQDTPKYHLIIFLAPAVIAE